MSQLWMERNVLADIPGIPVPDGYLLRTFRPGDEPALARIYDVSGLGTATPEAVRIRMMDHPCYKPERIYLIEDASGPVGTAAAWVEPFDPGAGYLHMVGVMPGHRGKRLGAIVVTATIRHTRDEGFSVQRLKTDDFREDAIRLYAGLGYYPLYAEDAHQERWLAIAERLGNPGILRLAHRFTPPPGA